MYYYTTILHAIQPPFNIHTQMYKALHVSCKQCTVFIPMKETPSSNNRLISYNNFLQESSTPLLIPFSSHIPLPSSPSPSSLFQLSSQIKPKPLHTSPVLGNHIRARGLRVLGRGEQHALVAGGFLFFAHAAGLDFGRAFVAGWFV